MRLTVIYLYEYSSIALRRFTCNFPLRFNLHPITEEQNKQLEDMLVYIAPRNTPQQIVIVDEDHQQGYSLDKDDIAKINERIEEQLKPLRASYGFSTPPLVMKHAGQQPVKYTLYSSDLVLVEHNNYISAPMHW